MRLPAARGNRSGAGPRIGPRVVLAALLVASALFGQRVRLYLVGGGDLMVREYEVVDDRIRYYSVERSAWEEIPAEMVDLERTEAEVKRRAASREERARDDAVERAAERKARTELHDVPIDDGVYYRNGDEILPLEQAETILEGSKKRTLLKIVAPIPMAGKKTLELEGTQAAFVVDDPRPQFYIRLGKIDRLVLVRLKDKKKRRLIQVIQTAPQSDQRFEEQEEVEVFRQQLAGTVYKIWPIKPLPAGNYAIVEHAPGEDNARVWDFTSVAATPPSAERPSSPQ